MELGKIKPTEAIIVEEKTYTVSASFTFKESDLEDLDTRAFFDMLSEVSAVDEEDAEDAEPQY